MRSCPGAEHTHGVTFRHNADTVLDKAPGQEAFSTVSTWISNSSDRLKIWRILVLRGQKWPQEPLPRLRKPLSKKMLTKVQHSLYWQNSFDQVMWQEIEFLPHFSYTFLSRWHALKWQEGHFHSISKHSRYWDSSLWSNKVHSQCSWCNKATVLKTFQISVLWCPNVCVSRSKKCSWKGKMGAGRSPYFSNVSFTYPAACLQLTVLI